MSTPIPSSSVGATRSTLMMNVQQALHCIERSGLWPLHSNGCAQGLTLVGDPNTAFGRVHTDTRSLQSGDLFVALRGEKFDAHDFLPQAKAQGAVAAIADRPTLAAMRWEADGRAEAPSSLSRLGLSGLCVEGTALHPNTGEAMNTLDVLAALAAGWRKYLGNLAMVRTGQDLPVIAVTGSNGKTTVTQMIASILSAAYGDAAWATQGNLNNAIGVPLSVLGLRPGHCAAVFELGMNHPGEIAQLAQIAQANIALVNNAQREHLEFMQSIDAVAAENGSVIGALPLMGTAVFPSDDVFAPLWRGLAHGRACLDFALQSHGAPAAAAKVAVTAQAEWLGDRADAECRAETAWKVQAHTPAGRLDFCLALPGQHNLKNALAAAACCVAANVPVVHIAAGLSAFQAVGGRSRAMGLRLCDARGSARSVSVVDDSYNANPDSVRAAIDVLAALPAPHLLVLGDMGEVGDQGAAFHAEVGEYAAHRGIENLYCTGELMRYAAAAFPQAKHFASVDSLNLAVSAAAPEHRSVLVKGSRFMQMERVVKQLESLQNLINTHPRPSSLGGSTGLLQQEMRHAL
jgi:UDP-N-acetylmuramoyl-tripeptide--D-alanyl-D-alanine ligase